MELVESRLKKKEKRIFGSINLININILILIPSSIISLKHDLFTSDMAITIYFNTSYLLNFQNLVLLQLKFILYHYNYKYLT